LAQGCKRPKQHCFPPRIASRNFSGPEHPPDDCYHHPALAMARFDTCLAVLLALKVAAAVADPQPVCPAGGCRDDEEEIAVIQTRASPQHRHGEVTKTSTIAEELLEPTMKVIHVINSPIYEECAETTVAIPEFADEEPAALISRRQETESSCGFLATLTCGGTVGATLAACGLFGTVTVGLGAWPCLAAFVPTIGECSGCLCAAFDAIAGPSSCSSILSLSQVANGTVVVGEGTCESYGFTVAAGEETVFHAPITGEQRVFNFYKKP